MVDTPVLTVIIPAFNEVRTIIDVLSAVGKSPYSTSLMMEVRTARRTRSNDGLRVASAMRNLSAIRRIAARGPRYGLAWPARKAWRRSSRMPTSNDYPQIVGPILAGEVEVVYGSRYLRSEEPLPWTPNRVCVNLLNLMVRILYGLRITDEATCYKAFRTDLLRWMDLRCERFESCPEVTAKAARMGVVIHEVPIRYCPRDHEGGKKIRWPDGIEAIVTLCCWLVARFVANPPSRPSRDEPTSISRRYTEDKT